jgi:glutamate synthase (NADPH) small chain
VLSEGVFNRVSWQNDPKNGKPKMMEIPGSEFSLKIDMVLLAMGFLHVTHNRLTDDLGVELDERGNIKFDKRYSTSVDGVFVAGDAGTGASLVVRAIYHGREAAKMVGDYLE